MPRVLCVTLVGILTVIGYAILRRNKNKQHHNAPPCLPSIPVLGSLPFLSGIQTLHLCMTEKSKKYGPIFSFYMGSRYTIVLSGHDAIREAYVKNAQDYTGRGKLYFETHIWQDPGKGVAMSTASDLQRKLRNNSMIVLKELGYGNRTVAESCITREIECLLDYIRKQNGKPWYPLPIVQQLSMNVIYNIMFSCRFDYESELANFVQHGCDSLARAAEMTYDIFPWIVYLPNIRNKINKYRTIYKNLLSLYEVKVEEGLNSKETNFVKSFVKISGDICDKRELAVIVRDLIEGGTETTGGQLSWFLILMANNQEVQKRVQQEIDSILPRDQLPTLDDRAKLPYVEATVLEVLRIRTPVPLSLMRTTTADTKLGDFHIPCGTQVLANLWSAHMDPELWGDPEIFRPERFLNKDSELINRDLVIAFSLGRRSCIGEALARQELFLVFSALVHQFDILPPEGETRVSEEVLFAVSLGPVYHNIRFVARQ